MEVWAELTEPNTSGTVGTSHATDTSVNGTLFQTMAKMGGVAVSAGSSVIKATVPLQFWFCRNPGLALPLIALQYHEVKLKITFSSVTGTGSGLDCEVWCDYIYLDTDERRRFAQVSHEYLIEQVQNVNTSGTKSHDITFNHPVKELVWTGNESVNATLVAPAGGNTRLVLNGHDRMAERPERYFTQTQIWQHHTGTGGLLATAALGGGHSNTIAVYSFALKPEEHQPSGTCNFSRIDNAQLKTTNSVGLNIYAVNYNVLRVMSGMGGLAYSN
jgi:hypothetical protein